MEIKENRAHVAKTDEIDLDEMREGLVDVVELELIRPIKNAGGEEVERVTFEEPTGKHVELMGQAGSQKAAMERSFRVLGECMGMSPDEVKNMKSRDLVRLGQVLKYFLPDSSVGMF